MFRTTIQLQLFTEWMSFSLLLVYTFPSPSMGALLDHSSSPSPRPIPITYSQPAKELKFPSTTPTPHPTHTTALKKNYFRIILDLQNSCKEFPYTSPASFPIFTSYSTICHLPKLRNQHWYITLNSRLCFELFFHPYPQSIPRANSGYHTLHSMIVSQFFLIFHDF